MDAFTLAATLSLVLDLKSVITALAVVFRHITVEEACQASALEEIHQKVILTYMLSCGRSEEPDPLVWCAFVLSCLYVRIGSMGISRLIS